MKSQTKEKAEVRKANLDPSQEAIVVLCHQDLGIRCVSFGRQVSVSEVMTVLSNTHRNLQLHLLKMTSVERARKRRRRTRRRAIAPDRQVRGSNSSGGSQSLKDKGGKPSSSGSAAVCLMRALMMVAVVNPSTSTHRVPEGICLSAVFQPAFCHASYTQSHCFIWGQR